MKNIITAFITMVLLSAGYKAQSQPGFGNIGFNTFYTELSPYGQWINNADYGQVWVSNENGFEPYSNNGHWDFTSYGWTWVSDYSWGWAPFHYGRWAYLPAYGWAWVPGYEWAPAWVGWCSYDGYYGWAPLSPGLSFNYSFSSIPYERWRFVQYQYINNPYVYNHYVRPPRNINSNNITIINNTTVNNNVTYAAGPAKLDVERLTKTTIQPKAVAFDETPGKKTVIEKNEIRMYRPAIVKDAATEKIKPATQTKLPVKEEVAGKQSTRQQSVNQQQVLIKQTPQQDEIKKQQQAELINKQQIQEQQQQELVRQQQREEIRQQQEQIKKQQQQELIKEQQQEQIHQQKMRQQEIRRQEREQRVMPVQREPVEKTVQPLRKEKRG